MDENGVIALYGFRSKQEYIYRTNRMREITGASELIAGLYSRFTAESPVPIDADWRGRAWSEPHGAFDGAVVYEGGGNLCILYRTHSAYVCANRFFSRMILDCAPGLGLIAACVARTDDFEADMKSLRAAYDAAKNSHFTPGFCNVLPFTLVERTTFQPVSTKRAIGGELVEYSRESACKREAYELMSNEEKLKGKFIDDIIDEKGKDSLIAVVYCDGNSIGQRLRKAMEGNGSLYSTNVEALRDFSVKIHEAFVERPLAAIGRALSSQKESRRGYRVVIDHGDEITLVVNAHVVPMVIDAYLSSVEETEGLHACVGVAICHSHDPFSEVYRIAEQCCESAKKKNRGEILRGGADASYVDFHYCRSGLTGSLDQIRGTQEAHLTLRPYLYRSAESSSVDLKTFLEFGARIADSPLSRGDVKTLGNVILANASPELANSSRFQLEIERLKTKEGASDKTIEEMERMAGQLFAKLVFDISNFYDVWFAKDFGDTEGETGE